MAVLFFFNDTATTEIYTLSLHDALPILGAALPSIARQTAVLAVAHGRLALCRSGAALGLPLEEGGGEEDRKSTRLNSSHSQISYAVFCLKKKTVLNARLGGIVLYNVYDT